jgi:hypothetical protein
MSFVFSSKMAKEPFKCVLYGKPKVGKTTFAAEAKNAVLVGFERGANFINGCPKIEVDNLDDLRNLSNFLMKESEIEVDGEKQKIETIIFDSATSLQEIFAKDICKVGGKESIDDFGYGRGYQLLREQFEKIVQLARNFNAKGKNFILIAHESCEQVHDLVIGDHTKFNMSAGKGIAEKITSQFDVIAYMKTVVLKNSDTKAIAANEQRIIMLRGHPGAVLGCRNTDLPDFYQVQTTGNNKQFWELF